MTALCVDDEPIMLVTLKEAVEASPDIDTVYGFEEESDALAFADTHRIDVAFLDIELHEMSGMELTKRLREKTPYLPIIFCTGYSEYELEAMRLHADGYLLKPISADAVQNVLLRLRGMANKAPLVFASEDGLELKDKLGESIAFSRGRTSELVKLLLDAKGELKSTDELCEKLFGSTPGFLKKDRNYLFHLINDLRTALSEHGADAVLIRAGQSYGLNMKLIDFEPVL